MSYGTGVFIVMALILLNVAVRLAPAAYALASGLWRERGVEFYVFLALALAAALYAFPSRAQKGGGGPCTNGPCALPPPQVLPLWRAPDGRLYPVGPRIMEVNREQ